MFAKYSGNPAAEVIPGVIGLWHPDEANEGRPIRALILSWNNHLGQQTPSVPSHGMEIVISMKRSGTDAWYTAFDDLENFRVEWARDWQTIESEQGFPTTGNLTGVVEYLGEKYLRSWRHPSDSYEAWRVDYVCDVATATQGWGQMPANGPQSDYTLWSGGNPVGKLTVRNVAPNYSEIAYAREHSNRYVLPFAGDQISAGEPMMPFDDRVSRAVAYRTAFDLASPSNGRFPAWRFDGNRQPSDVVNQPQQWAQGTSSGYEGVLTYREFTDHLRNNSVDVQTSRFG